MIYKINGYEKYEAI